MLFNADRSAIMTFKIDYEKEKDCSLSPCCVQVDLSSRDFL